MKRFSLIIILMALAAGRASADGILLPVEHPHTIPVAPGELFTVKYHHVTVNIENRACTTSVDQAFYNDANVDREGVYVFPMPEGSVVTKFSMFADEKEIAGKIYTKEEARAIYESIVRRRKDPALLEYVGRNLFKASVYPVPAKDNKRIKLSYAEVLAQTGGTRRYVYPLSTERFSKEPLEDCRLTVNIASDKPITSVFCPSHKVTVERRDDHHAKLTWHAKDVKPDTDMVVYYTVSSDDIGIDILTHRDSGKNGFYLLLASPRIELDQSKVAPKNVVFVLDRTGSMAGEKIEQAKEALKFCLNTLRGQDRFNLISFNESPEAVFGEMAAASKQNVGRALDELEQITANGGTNIDGALRSALEQLRNAPGSKKSDNNYVVFLTDGLPTVGVTDIETILKNAKQANDSNARVFSFGVGYDVNTHLLDRLAQQSKGSADYVRPRETIESKVSAFFAKVSDPLLSDVRVEVDGVKVFDMYPQETPDLFKGSELMIIGRYSGAGKARITLSGTSQGRRRTFTVEAVLPGEEQANAFIPQLWASRKIGFLLDEIRLHSSDELIQQVISLSKEYGIPTEYTSFLADDRKFTAMDGHAAAFAREKMDTARGAQSGTWGVAQSANAQTLNRQAYAPAAAAPAPNAGVKVLGKVAANQRVGGVFYDEQDRPIVVANVQNVAKRTFYQRGDYWEDVNLKPNQKLVRIKQFSDAHFALMKLDARIAQYSSLGNVRIVLDNGQAVEIGAAGKEKLSDAELRQLASGPRKESRSPQNSLPRAASLLAGAFGALATAARVLRECV